MLIVLEPGQELGDHQVKEHAWLVVVDGQRRRVRAGGEASRPAPGTLVRFEPDERHSVSHRRRARGSCCCSRRGPARATTAASVDAPKA